RDPAPLRPAQGASGGILAARARAGIGERVVRVRRLLLLVLLAAALFVALPRSRQPHSQGSFLPRIARMAGVRFDPAFFYDGKRTARELAAEIVARASAAGLDTLFFRAYDPGYGANYRTDLAWSTETDFGHQDLLRFVLEEAHAQGMKVHAWLTMLNHRGAWEAHEAWR